LFNILLHRHQYIRFSYSKVIENLYFSLLAMTKLPVNIKETFVSYWVVQIHCGPPLPNFWLAMAHLAHPIVLQAFLNLVVTTSSWQRSTVVDSTIHSARIAGGWGWTPL